MNSYAMAITGATTNLFFSLMPGNNLAWVNAIIFFGCMAALGGMAAWDTMELCFGGKKKDK